MPRGRKGVAYDLNSPKGRWRNTAPGCWQRGDGASVRKVTVGLFDFWTGIAAHGAKPIPRFVGQDRPQYWDTAKAAMAGVDAWQDAENRRIALALRKAEGRNHG